MEPDRATVTLSRLDSPARSFGLESRSLEVQVSRGATVESRHRVQAVVRRAGGATDVTFGDPGAATFWRSAAKPFQTLPVIEDGAAEAFGFGAEQLAVACASHGGRAEHLVRVSGMLTAIDADEETLHCGPHVPYDDDVAAALVRDGEPPRRLHNNCSGKHTALLALARHRGWDADGYWRFDHPVQRRVRAAVARWIQAEPDGLAWETDGCGLPTPFLPLREMALAFGRLVEAARAGEAAPAAVVNAMTGSPELTSSPGREPLRIMQAGRGRLLAKEGAEGVLCVAALDDDWGLALKVVDGARRAVGPAAVAVLTGSDLLETREAEALESLAAVPLEGTTGERVGTIVGVIRAVDV